MKDFAQFTNKKLTSAIRRHLLVLAVAGSHVVLEAQRVLRRHLDLGYLLRGQEGWGRGGGDEEEEGGLNQRGCV